MQKRGRFVSSIGILLLVSAAFLAFPGLKGLAKADDFPNKPINLLIPMAAGGATDQIMRAITLNFKRLCGPWVIGRFSMVIRKFLNL